MQEYEIPWLEELFDALYQYTWILDSHGRVIKANRAARQLVGSGNHYVTGMPLWLVSWPGLSRQNRKIVKLVVNQAMRGKTANHELEFQRRGQSVQTINFSLRPILSENGEPAFIVAEGHDITIYKRTSDALSQSEARF
jgi:PAS domain S-box-containing protein